VVEEMVCEKAEEDAGMFAKPVCPIAGGRRRVHLREKITVTDYFRDRTGLFTWNANNAFAERVKEERKK
jgi:hypothetical protein